MTKEQLLCKLENIEKNIDYQKREFELLIIKDVPASLIKNNINIIYNLYLAKKEIKEIITKIKEDMNNVSEHKS